jgi:protein-tyrosine phosphatase
VTLRKLLECGVCTIIRLNEEEYDRGFFLQNGIDHVDIIFEDGTVPDEVNFLHSRTK